MTDRCDKCGREFKKTRSLNQNAYMFGVVYKLLSNQLGYSVDEIHDLMKHKFLGRILNLSETEFYNIPISTTELDTKGMEDYLQQIREWADSINCYIPLPNEVPFEAGR